MDLDQTSINMLVS